VADVVRLPYLTAQSLTHAESAQFVRVSEKSDVHHYPYHSMAMPIIKYVRCWR